MVIIICGYDMEKYKYKPDDIEVGNAVEFYNEGWRNDIVTSKKVIKKRKSKRIECIIHLERLGKVNLESIRRVYFYDNKVIGLKPPGTSVEALFE